MKHNYAVQLLWAGAAPAGNDNYSREFEIHIPNKPPLIGSADPAYKGDPTLYTPEDFLVASISSCQMLTYIALAEKHGVHVIGYEDNAQGEMQIEKGIGRFLVVTLFPKVSIEEGADRNSAMRLHESAHKRCFIANSVNFPVNINPTVVEVSFA